MYAAYLPMDDSLGATASAAASAEAEAALRALVADTVGISCSLPTTQQWMWC